MQSPAFVNRQVFLLTEDSGSLRLFPVDTSWKIISIEKLVNSSYAIRKSDDKPAREFCVVLKAYVERHERVLIVTRTLARIVGRILPAVVEEQGGLFTSNHEKQPISVIGVKNEPIQLVGRPGLPRGASRT